MLRDPFRKKFSAFAGQKIWRRTFLNALTGLKAVLKNMLRGFSEKKNPGRRKFHEEKPEDEEEAK